MYTVFIRIVAVATINFAPSSVRLLIERGYYLFRARACVTYTYRLHHEVEVSMLFTQPRASGPRLCK